MENNNLPMQIIQMIKNGGNPQQIVLSMLEQSSAGNPVIENLVNLAKNNDKKGIEDFARNMFKERGLDFDKEFTTFKNYLGL